MSDDKRLTYDKEYINQLLIQANMVLRWFGHEMPKPTWTDPKTVAVSRYYTFKSFRCIHEDCRDSFKVCIMFRNAVVNQWVLTDHFLQCNGIVLDTVQSDDKPRVLARTDIKEMYCRRISILL